MTDSNPYIIVQTNVKERAPGLLRLKKGERIKFILDKVHFI